MEQTAVEWLEKRFLETDGNLYAEDFTKAKEMEKKQIIDAWNSAYGGDGNYEAKQYYNETFKNTQNETNNSRMVIKTIRY